MGSNLTSKIYKLLDFVYFFFNLYKLLFSNLKKKKNKKTLLLLPPPLNAMPECWERQCRYRTHEPRGSTGASLVTVTAWINSNTPAAPATITTTVYKS